MGLLRRFRAAWQGFRSPIDANSDGPSAKQSDVVSARVFGTIRKLRLISPAGFYHIHAELIESSDGKTGMYLIDYGAVVPEDQGKFKQFIEDYAKRGR